MEGTPYVFLDESGNFDFGEKGSTYFIVTAVTMRRPIEIDSALSAYRYECLDSGWGPGVFPLRQGQPRRPSPSVRDYQ